MAVLFSEMICNPIAKVKLFHTHWYKNKSLQTHPFLEFFISLLSRAMIKPREIETYILLPRANIEKIAVESVGLIENNCESIGIAQY